MTTLDDMNDAQVRSSLIHEDNRQLAICSFALKVAVVSQQMQTMVELRRFSQVRAPRALDDAIRQCERIIAEEFRHTFGHAMIEE